MRTLEQNQENANRRAFNKVHLNGVKTVSFLNDLNYFKISNGLPPDIMHDVLESCFRYAFSCLIPKLKELKLYSIKKFRQDLEKFDYGRIDLAHKVPTSLFTDAFTFKLSATNMWNLARLFPFITGEHLKNDNHFMNFVELVEIFRIMNRFEFQDDVIDDLKNRIHNYLVNFKNLYPSFSIKPKQHFLIHYPNAIRNFGPPRSYSTMRFESKHSYFKAAYKSIHNQINVCKSLSNRHQLLQVYHLLCSKYFVDFEFGSSLKLDSFLVQLIEMEFNSSEFLLFTWAKIKGIKYQVNDIVFLNKLQNIPVFGQLVALIYFQDDFRLMIKEIETKEYVDFFTAYCLEEVNDWVYKYYSIENLLVPWPLDLYHKDGKKFVIPKYGF
jgi:hypothetical protein